MNDNLVFLEFADETSAYVHSWKNDPSMAERSHIIPLSLEARLILQKNNIPFNTTLPYFDSYAHHRGLVRSEEWLKLIEEYIDDDTPLAAELCFCTRPLFNYLLWLTEIISNAGEKRQPLSLSSCSETLPQKDNNWKLVPHERFLGALVKQYAGKIGRVFKKIDNTIVSTPANGGSRDIMNQSIGTLERPGLLARFLVALYRRHLKKRKKILLASGSYGLGNVISESVDHLPGTCITELDIQPGSANPRRISKLILTIFKRKFSAAARKEILQVPLYIFPPGGQEVEIYARNVKEKLDGLVKQIEGPWRKQFEHRGLDLAPLIVYKLRNGIGRHLVSVAYQLGRLGNLLTSINPDLVFSPYSGTTYTWLGEMCARRDIPAIMVTHGTHIPPKNRMDEIEHWRLSRNLMLAPTYKYTLAQTPWATRHAEYYKYIESTMNTGPLLFARTDTGERDELRKKLGVPDDGLLVVYAVTQRKRSSVKFHVFETEDEYLQDMADLVEAVNRLENVYLVLKLHPSSEFSDSDIRSVLPQCDRLWVLHREPFNRVLSATDLLVSYSSTTIEEAVLNRIPVVLYDRWKRYCHIEALDCDTTPNGEWKTDAVYYVREPKRLADVLDHALRNAEDAKKNNNLYKKHLFSSGEYQPLAYHIERFLSKQ